MKWFYLVGFVITQNCNQYDVSNCTLGECCSVWGYCGSTEKHCGKTHRKGLCGVIRNVTYVCRDGLCCSDYGYCLNCRNKTKTVYYSLNP